MLITLLHRLALSTGRSGTVPPRWTDPSGNTHPTDFHSGFNIIITPSQQFPTPGLCHQRILKSIIHIDLYLIQMPWWAHFFLFPPNHHTYLPNNKRKANSNLKTIRLHILSSSKMDDDDDDGRLLLTLAFTLNCALHSTS